MRQPLDSFADRLVRNGEVTEFVRGLVKEKGIPAEAIIMALKAEKVIDPHDPDGGEDVVGH